jgi:hypothetical protein
VLRPPRLCDSSGQRRAPEGWRSRHRVRDENANPATPTPPRAGAAPPELPVEVELATSTGLITTTHDLLDLPTARRQITRNAQRDSRPGRDPRGATLDQIAGHQGCATPSRAGAGHLCGMRTGVRAGQPCPGPGLARRRGRGLPRPCAQAGPRSAQALRAGGAEVCPGLARRRGEVCPGRDSESDRFPRRVAACFSNQRTASLGPNRVRSPARLVRAGFGTARDDRQPQRGTPVPGDGHVGREPPARTAQSGPLSCRPRCRRAATPTPSRRVSPDPCRRPSQDRRCTRRSTPT